MTEISYKGANCVVIQTKGTMLITDPRVDDQKPIKAVEKAEAQLLTQEKFGVSTAEGQKIFNFPGEYEVGDMSLVAVDAQSQLDPAIKSVMYRVASTDAAIAIVGHVNPDAVEEDQFEALGIIDVLIIPVGGNGYTIDPHGAVKLTRHINPKVVIPVHFKEDGITYEVEQLSLELFAKELGTPIVQESTFKLKQASQLPEVLTLVQLDKTA